jgi:endonuclease YncB( thermonuclease family)
VADSAESPPRSLASSKPEDFLTGGELEFVEVTGLSGNETNRLQAAVAPTGGWNKFASLNLGTLKLTRTSTRLMLRVSHARGGGGVMHLKEIRLTPAKPHAAPSESAATVSTEFAKIRSDHETRLRALEQPIVDTYKAKLQTVEKQFTTAKDTENAEAVKAEAQRADHALAQTAASHPGMQISASAEGFEEIRDATFVDAPSNTGDQFLISANSQQIPVRLLWVTCPSPLAEDTSNHKFLSQYFGISVDDSVALGRQAQEFTAAYLKDKSLRVLTRWQKDKNGAVLASIQPGELGDFAGILVDNGLAAINPLKESKGLARRRADENAVSVLKEREAAAKAKPLPPGAWSLSTGK